MNALRAPGEPRASDPSVPGFGICDHPEHWSAAWIVEGAVVDGQAIGKCAKHASIIPGVDDLEPTCDDCGLALCDRAGEAGGCQCWRDEPEAEL